MYPFIAGRSFEWGEFASAEHRRRVLDLVVAVHTAPATARQHALTDDFTVPHRDELAAAVSPGSEAAPAAGRTQVRYLAWSGGTRDRSSGCWSATTRWCSRPSKSRPGRCSPMVSPIPVTRC